MDVLDAGAEYRLVVDVPGATKDDVEVKPGDVQGTVSIRAKGRDVREASGQALVAERGIKPGTTVSFARAVPVAWDADVHRLKTEVKDGVLVVTIPKSTASEEKKP